jgi:gluconate kinase
MKIIVCVAWIQEYRDQATQQNMLKLDFIFITERYFLSKYSDTSLSYYHL